MAENLGEALKRYLRDSSRYFSLRDRSHTLLSAAPTADPWIGHTRTFAMTREETADNPQIPPDVKDVARRVPEILAELPEPFAAYVDSMVRRDMGNLSATADIIDPDTGEILAREVPAYTLMALNKALGEWVTLMNDLPVAPPGDRWVRDPDDPSILTAPATQSIRNQRVRRAVKINDETERHPAQFDLRDEDVPVATITHTKHHGGMLPVEKRQLVQRAQRVQLAIGQALERADAATEVPEVSGVGASLVRVLLPGVE